MNDAKVLLSHNIDAAAPWWDNLTKRAEDAEAALLMAKRDVEKLTHDYHILNEALGMCRGRNFRLKRESTELREANENYRAAGKRRLTDNTVL